MQNENLLHLPECVYNSLNNSSPQFLLAIVLIKSKNGIHRKHIY